jgi:chromate transport protein ChrA
LAAQLAIYLGYVHYRILGATLVGIAFVLPSFLMVVALGWAYVRFGGLTWMQSVFYGVGAAVIGIIAISAYKLTTRSVGKDKLLWAIYLLLCAVTVITESEVAWLFLASGVLVWLWRAPPKWLGHGRANAIAAIPAPAASALLGTIDWPLLSQIGLFFAKAGAFVFGSGLAIVPFLYGGVVTEYHWLNEKQFVDAVAVAMITPGPVVITVGFIGYLVAGLPGACMAAAHFCRATSSPSCLRLTSRSTASCLRSSHLWTASRPPPWARYPAQSSCWPGARSSMYRRCCWQSSPSRCSSGSGSCRTSHRGGAAALGLLIYPLLITDKETAMQWITREHPKIDRIACPWLIARFIDDDAGVSLCATRRCHAHRQ